MLAFALGNASGGQTVTVTSESAVGPGKPLNALANIDIRTTDPLRAPILGQTIGGIIADGVAGRRSAGAGTKPGETAAADTAAAKEPVPGEGGGQVGEEIVVTGSRNRGSEAARLQRIAAFEAALQARQAAEQRDADKEDASTSVDRGNHPYPVQPEEMGGLTEWQLRAKRAAYMGAVEASGERYTDHDLNVKAFDDLIAQAHVREAPGVAAANAAAIELVRSGLPPLDTALSAVSVARGQGSFGDYVNVISSVLPFLKPAGKVLGKVGAKGANVYADLARSATRNPNSMTVILGRFKATGRSYDRFAEKNGFSYFYAENYDDLQKAGVDMWEVNKTFLEQQAAAGKQFVLTHSPFRAASGGFAREVTWLVDNGYSFVKEGRLWKAVK